jgi:hypothetical protein
MPKPARTPASPSSAVSRSRSDPVRFRKFKGARKRPLFLCPTTSAQCAITESADSGQANPTNRTKRIRRLQRGRPGFGRATGRRCAQQGRPRHKPERANSASRTEIASAPRRPGPDGFASRTPTTTPPHPRRSGPREQGRVGRARHRSTSRANAAASRSHLRTPQRVRADASHRRRTPAQGPDHPKSSATIRAPGTAAPGDARDRGARAHRYGAPSQRNPAASVWSHGSDRPTDRGGAVRRSSRSVPEDRRARSPN